MKATTSLWKAGLLGLSVSFALAGCAAHQTKKTTPAAPPAAVAAPASATPRAESKPEVIARLPVRSGIQLAVMPLVNKTGVAAFDDAGPVLSERISIRLSGYPHVVVVERARFNEVLDELALTERVPIDGAKAVQIGRLLGANFMIFGSLVKLGAQPSISLRIVSVETGEIIGGAMIDTAGSEDFDRASNATAKELMAAIVGVKATASAKQ